MSKRIDNIDLIIATRDLCKHIMVDNDINMSVFEVGYPTKKTCNNLPDEFLVVKSIVQRDTGDPKSEGAVEICIYVANRTLGADQSQANLSRIKQLTGIFVSGLQDASKNRVAFNDFRTTLVRDSDIGYFYQSIVINTVSINLV